MLLSSKTKNEKIVLGLLSYTFTSENQKNNEELKQILKSYQEDDNYDVFLYSKKENENYIGVLVIETMSSDDGHETIVLHRIGVIPSFRNEGVGYNMYLDLRRKYPNSVVIGSLDTTSLVTNWSQKYEEEKGGNKI